MVLRGAVVLCLALVVLSAPAAGAVVAQGLATGSIRGTVDVRSPLSVPAPPEGPDRPAAPQAYRQAVVFLETAPPGAEPPPASRVAMHQKDATFAPHLLAIGVGSTVDFPNDDLTYHNVFSLSKTRRFDLGRYAAGRSKAVRFDRPGIVRVFCDIHSQMNAFILVFDHRFFALTDANGRYRIDRVPPGSYRVTAWYEGVARQAQTVTVAPGAATELTFALR